MHTPTSRSDSLDVPQKPSPTASGVARKLKVSGTDSSSHSSPNPAAKSPKDQSPKVDRKSRRSSEKKKSRHVVELEARLAELQEELKDAKDELRCSEQRKRNAQQEADDAKKWLTSMSIKLDETRERIKELSGCSNDRVRELDREEKSADLRIELSDTLDLVEELTNELSFSKESESQALEEVGRIRTMLEFVKSSEEALKSEHVHVAESCKSLLAELELSQNRANSLQKFVDHQSKTEVNNLKNEANRLKDAIESTKKWYENQRLETATQVQNAYELVERAKHESFQREAELEAKLKESMAEHVRLHSKSVLRDLQRQEVRLRSVAEENEALKSQIAKMEMERSAAREAMTDKSWQRAAEELDAARATGLEMEAELRILTVQSDQWRKAAEVAAAMLSTENVGKCMVDRTVSFGCDRIGGRLRSPYYEEMDDHSSLGKIRAAGTGGNVLKRIGLLLKKGSR